jgi:hypothetical protein
MSCDDISADWAAQRIKGLSLGSAVVNSLIRPFRRKGAAHEPLEPGLPYPEEFLPFSDVDNDSSLLRTGTRGTHYAVL